jgi:hypothetical protein
MPFPHQILLLLPFLILVLIAVGGSVTWNYTSGASEHEIGADDGTFTGGILMPGQMYTASAFTIARNYPYHCAIHSFMRGTVIAVGSPPHDANNDGIVPVPVEFGEAGIEE